MRQNSLTNLANRKCLRHYRAGLIALALFAGTISACPRASADVGVVLEEALDNGLSRITASGHSAVYFSNICADGPVKLRLCRDDEQGSVITTYQNFGESGNYDWNVVPLNIYMYGMADADRRPLVASAKIKAVLEDEYRKKFLAEYCTGPCETNLKANWRSTVGATFNRSVYVFVVRTTVEQDLETIQKLNALSNKNNFSMFVRNCADFVVDVINGYFPHAAHRNFINDFGMTSPKAVARSFAQFARQRPDLQYHVLHFAQLPGTYKRSDKTRLGTELPFHEKIFLAPLVPLGILSVHETLPVFFGTYMLTGRFNPQHEWENHASPEVTALGFQVAAAKSEKDKARIAALQAEKKNAKATVAGDSEIWAQRRSEFESFLAESTKDPSAPKIFFTKHTFKELDRAGTPFVDEEGSVWMDLRNEHGERKVGLTASNLLTPESNRDLAYEIILARVNHVLKSPSHSRETIPEFQNDWMLLQQAHAQIVTSTSRVKDASPQ
jgi:hypothetical protein